MTEQDAYNRGYDNPAKSSRDYAWQHVVDVNAFNCGKMDRQNQQPRNSEYCRDAYDPVTGERNLPQATVVGQ